MGKKHIFIKRIFPVLTISVMVSALYYGSAMADEASHTIYLTSVTDEVEIEPGYYKDPVHIKTDFQEQTSFAAAPYSDGDNSTISGSVIDTLTSLPLDRYKSGNSYIMNLGINEQIALGPGYYYGNINIRNAIKNNGQLSLDLTGSNISGTYDIEPGYYEGGTVTLHMPENITADTYSGGNNDTVSSEAITGLTSIPLAGYVNDEGTYEIDLGVDEQIVLEPGYYTTMNIRNGIADKGEFNAVLNSNLDGMSVTLEPGYFSGGTVSQSPELRQLKDALGSFLTTYTEDDSFSEIASQINNINRESAATVNRYTMAEDSSQSQEAPENLDLSMEVIDENHNGIDNYLGVNEKVTIKNGYYSDDFTIMNGVKDRGNPSVILDGDSQSVRLPEGYYTDGTIGIDNSFNTLRNKIAAIFGITLEQDATFSEIIAAITGSSFQHNQKATASYTEKTSGTNDRIGTSADAPTMTNVAIAGETLDLGIDETIVIPAGYYDEDITIRNGVVHQPDVDTTVSANNNSTYGSKTVEYSAGYYDSIEVKDNTPNGKLTKKSKSGVVKTYNPVTNAWE